MKRLLNYFLRGLAVTAPVAVTLYVCWEAFLRIDGWLGLPIPGVGFVATIAAITLVGFLASNLVTRGAVGLVDELLGRLPLVRLLYNSVRDLLDAFVGEKRRFRTPVVVTVDAATGVKALGFVTQDSLAAAGLAGYVAVYFPFSYSVAGRVLFVPTEQVQPLAVEAAGAMAFVVSGGVSEMTALSVTPRSPVAAPVPVPPTSAP